MRVSQVHQFLPSLGHRDAVGNHTLATQHILRSAGIRGGIWAEDVHPENRRKGRPFIDYARSRSARGGKNLLMYQASTGSNGMVDFLLSRPERLLIYYHNITPPEFFAPYDPASAVVLERGRLEIARICSRIDHALANSDYSAKELRALGVEDVASFPPFSPRIESEPSRSHAQWLAKTKRGIDVLFVGRLVPNKGHAHLLRAFAALRAGAEAQPRLFVVGSWGPAPYMRAVARLRDRLGPEGIVLAGSITEPRLAAHYQEADVFLSLSEHEGFGVPVLEAMRFGVPVVAYEGGAVGETLGGSGVLLRTLDPALVAEVVNRVACDEDLRRRIVERQHERVAELERIPRNELLLASVRSVFGES
ncbi:MAG TPA: glycosyltransferase family 4 protein [Actinomycetota bacterium]|nr:glycosyltransferase family 4 protein [Actinomycetota bacterium]